MKRPSENDLLSALREFGKAVPKRPEGKEWQTIKEMADAEDVSPPTIRYRLKMARARGVKVDVATGSELDESGNVKRAIYFRLRNGPK